MSEHKVAKELKGAGFPAIGRAFRTPSGYLLGWGAEQGVHESGSQGWSNDAVYLTVSLSGTSIGVNAGNSTTASWKAITIAS